MGRIIHVFKARRKPRQLDRLDREEKHRSTTSPQGRVAPLCMLERCRGFGYPSTRHHGGGAPIPPVTFWVTVTFLDTPQMLAR
jgi:hypothetical protein